MKNMIALITDFGLQDIYAGVMKAAVLRVCNAASIVDLTHSIPAQNIASGSFALAQSFRFLPEGAIALVVVDPGVGTSRGRIAAKIDERFYVGPDNGLLDDLLYEHEVQEAVSILPDRLYSKETISATFEGRDVFAKAAGMLENGEALSLLGDPIEVDELQKTRRLGLPRPQKTVDGAFGLIRAIDGYGNIVTDISKTMLGDSLSDYVVVRINGAVQQMPLVRAYGDVPEGGLCLLEGSFGSLEIACRDYNAAAVVPESALLCPVEITRIEDSGRADTGIRPYLAD
jgi:S-adenosylmethionine hydrolase